MGVQRFDDWRNTVLDKSVVGRRRIAKESLRSRVQRYALYTPIDRLLSHVTPIITL